MEQRNNKQNSVIFQVDEILNKMSNQVSFLIRKDQLMNQLDVDMLMENTRRLYDTLCSVRCNMDIDSIPMEIVEETSEILESENLRTSETENIEETSEEELSISASQHLSNLEYNLGDSEENLGDSVTQRLGDSEENLGDSVIQRLGDSEENLGDSVTQRLGDSEENLGDSVTQRLGDSEENLGDSEENLGDSVTQILGDSEENLGDSEENLGDSEENLGDSEEKEDSGIRAYKKEHQTLGDMLELIEDNSLVARLQRKPVADLMTAIGINDKFLLLNELFAGSMEKYNRSVRALNNFPTLLGAKTYMSELQIEFQWDINSEAYRKLNDLVERRFTPIHNS